jgi:hypothetical protein
VNIQEFRDDDGGYLEWIVVNPAGYVLNIPRGLNPSDAKLHRASCWTIDPRRRQMTMTESYIKLCSLDHAALDRWATARAGAAISRCGTCLPSGLRAASSPASQRRKSGNDHEPRPAQDLTRSTSAPEIQGPLVGRPIVEA